MNPRSQPPQRRRPVAGAPVKVETGGTQGMRASLRWRGRKDSGAEAPPFQRSFQGPEGHCSLRKLESGEGGEASSQAHGGLFDEPEGELGGGKDQEVDAESESMRVGGEQLLPEINAVGDDPDVAHEGQIEEASDEGVRLGDDPGDEGSDGGGRDGGAKSEDGDGGYS